MIESGGLLMYRFRNDSIEVFLVHPGGPFFARKDEGAWTIPKGAPEVSEPLEIAACREFEEETGIAPGGVRTPLGKIKQKGGKIVHAWAFEGDWEEAHGLTSNFFGIEWPPGSGKMRQFPEIDRAGFFRLNEARRKINPAQVAFLDRLAEIID